jgi:hypothetical protein
MSNDKKKYICKLPTNGYDAGQEAFLTEAEVANFNGGEEHPRFVLADEVGAADTPVETADAQPETPAAPTPEGEYTPDEEPKEETPAAPASTDTETTPPSTEGVE